MSRQGAHHVNRRSERSWWESVCQHSSCDEPLLNTPLRPPKGARDARSGAAVEDRGEDERGVEVGEERGGRVECIVAVEAVVVEHRARDEEPECEPRLEVQPRIAARITLQSNLKDARKRFGSDRKASAHHQACWAFLSTPRALRDAVSYTPRRPAQHREGGR